MHIWANLALLKLWWWKMRVTLELFCSVWLIAALIFSAGYYCARIFFTTRRWVLEKSFFKINFIGVIFEAGNETREKIWSDLVAEQKKSGAKSEWLFVHTAVFERARNWCMKKFSLSERNFFVHVRLLKAVFFCNFSCLWGLIMILYWIWARSDRNWRFQVVNLSFMQIWRFLISFADFSTKF